MEGADQQQAGVETGERPSVRAIAAALDACFERRGLGVRVARAAPVLGGFETYIYRLELAPTDLGGAPSLPIVTPLILRFGWRPDSAKAVVWESRAMEAARQAGIPAPRVYLVEPHLPKLGGAIMLMEVVCGVRLDQAALGAGIVEVIRLTRAYARMQAAIYHVPWRPATAQLPEIGRSALAPFASFEQRLHALDAEIETRGLLFLRPVLGWLQDHRGVIEQRRRVFLHGDCHPLNIFVEKDRVCGVIDWSAAGFGDRHEDIGWSSMLIATFTSADRAEDRRLGVFRTVGRWLYLAFLHDACRLDRAALRYGEVYGGLRWLLIFLPSYLPNAGPPVLNADAPAFTIPLYVRRVQRFLEQRTNLRLNVPLPARERREA